MSTLTQRLTAAMAGGAALMLAAPIAATAAPVPTLAAPVTPGAVQTIEGTYGALHKFRAYPGQFGREDPRAGTVEYVVAQQKRQDSDGHVYYRSIGKLTKIGQAVRVEISRMAVVSLDYSPAITSTNSTPVNSGAAVSIASSSQWVDATESIPTDDFRYISASMSFSVRWSDGTISGADVGAGDGNPSQYSYPDEGKKTNSVVAQGSLIANHYGDAAKGSVRVDVGLRLYANASGGGYSAAQPYASITKLNTRATRVQIDGVEARQVTAGGEFGGQPFNVTPRSSGTGNSASLSTAITSIIPNKQRPSSNTVVRVYYSVRWGDGTLSTNVYDSAEIARSLVFPPNQGF